MAPPTTASPASAIRQPRHYPTNRCPHRRHEMLLFTRVAGLPVVGLVENMSGYVCPCCGEVQNVFSTGGGEAMAQREETV